MLLWECGGLKLLTTVRGVKWNVILNCWDGNMVKGQLVFTGPQFFDKSFFSGRWFVSLATFLNNYSGKNDFKSNTALVMKV